MIYPFTAYRYKSGKIDEVVVRSYAGFMYGEPSYWTCSQYGTMGQEGKFSLIVKSAETEAEITRIAELEDEVKRMQEQIAAAYAALPRITAPADADTTK